MSNELSVEIIAALIAAFIAFIGFILTKENKISEFRQQWIDSLRADLAELLSILNKMSDSYSSSSIKIPGRSVDYSSMLLSQHKESIVRQVTKIKLRLNPEEKDSEFKIALDKVEKLVSNPIQVPRIKNVIAELEDSGHKLFKAEWERVKKGEPWFYWSKIATLSLFSIGFLITILLVIKEPVFKLFVWISKFFCGFS